MSAILPFNLPGSVVRLAVLWSLRNWLDLGRRVSGKAQRISNARDPEETLGRDMPDSLQQFEGSVMLAASSVDAMLNAKVYKDGDIEIRVASLAKSPAKKWQHLPHSNALLHNKSALK